MNKPYQETNETLQKSFKVHASQAVMCQCNDTFIFRLLAQSWAAMLTGHKLSDSAAGSQAVHQGQKRKVYICGTC